MASVSTDKTGKRRVLFFDANGKRRTIRLGAVPMKTVQEVCRRVEYIVTAQIANSAVDVETARWLGSIGDDLAKRLAKVGLVAPRASSSLSAFIKAYIEGRTDVKASTRTSMLQAHRRLVDFFGPNKALSHITQADADQWAIALKATFAEATEAFRLICEYSRGLRLAATKSERRGKATFALSIWLQAQANRSSKEQNKG